MENLGLYMFVPGNPVPKQSTRFDGHGHAHTDPRIEAWQQAVGYEANLRTSEINWQLTDRPVKLLLIFALGDKRRKDLDNLIKAVSDALNGIVFKDDSQVRVINARKLYNKDKPGVTIIVDFYDEKEDDHANEHQN